MDLPICFSILAVVSAGFAVLSTDTRKIVLTAWVAGMSVGALFLCFGAEYLAFVQCIVGTLVAIAFLVFATMFGEYGPVNPRTIREKIFDGIPAFLIGGAFFAMTALAVYDHQTIKSASSGPLAPNDLVTVGRALSERHFLSLQLVGFMLLAVLIGAGLVSRAEGGPSE